MPTVTATFVQATFVLATYVHIRNISAVTVLDPTNFLIPKNGVQKPWVKIVSVTAKIFLIWTNVGRTNVACTNVTVAVGIC